MSEFRLDSAGLKEAMSGANGPVFFHINRISTRVRDTARAICPTDTSKLKGSIDVEIRVENGMPVGIVGTNVEYALFVHEGTGIYGPRKRKIVPINGKALRWPKKNQTGKGRRRYKGGKTAEYVYSKSSKGSPGRPFLTDALKRVTGQG